MMVWADLTSELDLWADQGRIARFWWRDDDAIEPLPALFRLLDLTSMQNVEVGLAVIPALATDALATEIADRAHVVVLQHGHRHRNHAAPGKPAIECGGERPVAETLEELAFGLERLSRLFGALAVPILAPPWNNIDPAVATRLGSSAFVGLSTFGPRAHQPHASAIAVANAHVDPLDWRNGGHFAGLGKALSGIIGELRSRRTAMTEPDEPLGLLTHHLQHDSETWDFLGRFLDVTAAHPAARWLTIAESFADGRHVSAEPGVRQ